MVLAIGSWRPLQVGRSSNGFLARRQELTQQPSSQESQDLKGMIEEFVSRESDSSVTIDEPQFHYLFMFAVEKFMLRVKAQQRTEKVTVVLSNTDTTLFDVSGVYDAKPFAGEVKYVRRPHLDGNDGTLSMCKRMNRWQLTFRGEPVYVCSDGVFDSVPVPPEYGWVAADGLDRPKMTIKHEPANESDYRWW